MITWSVTSYFIIFEQNFRCSYLGASHFGCPPIFWKQFVLDMALLILTVGLIKAWAVEYFCAKGNCNEYIRLLIPK